MKKTLKSLGISIILIFVMFVIVGMFKLALGEMITFFLSPEWIEGVIWLLICLAYCTYYIYKGDS